MQVEKHIGSLQGKQSGSGSAKATFQALVFSKTIPLLPGSPVPPALFKADKEAG